MRSCVDTVGVTGKPVPGGIPRWRQTIREIREEAGTTPAWFWWVLAILLASGLFVACCALADRAANQRTRSRHRAPDLRTLRGRNRLHADCETAERGARTLPAAPTESSGRLVAVEHSRNPEAADLPRRDSVEPDAQARSMGPERRLGSPESGVDHDRGVRPLAVRAQRSRRCRTRRRAPPVTWPARAFRCMAS